MKINSSSFLDVLLNEWSRFLLPPFFFSFLWDSLGSEIRHLQRPQKDPWPFFLLAPPTFFSAAQPTGQGEESVVLLLVVGWSIFQFPTYIFWGVKRKIFVLKGVWKGKNFV